MKIFYSGYQKLIEAYYRNKKELGQVFMFHQIISYGEAIENKFSLSKEDFYKFIEALSNDGEIRSIDKMNLEDDCANYSYLTFDDIYSNAYENALQWLTERKIPFCVFITVNYLDKPNYISCAQLKNLSLNKYCTIGSHTISHPLLRFRNNSEIKNEFVNSKRRLEIIIGKEVKYLAYPYGSNFACSKKVIKIAQQSGYEKAFCTYSMGLNKNYLKNNQFFIPRINIDTNWIKKNRGLL